MMKHNTYNVFLRCVAAVLTIGAAACSNDNTAGITPGDGNNPGDAAGRTVTVRFDAGGQQTRTTVGGGGVWDGSSDNGGGVQAGSSDDAGGVWAGGNGGAGGVQTRTTVNPDDNYAVLWGEGDRLRVWALTTTSVGNDMTERIYTVEGGGASSPLTPADEGGEMELTGGQQYTFWSTYPYDVTLADGSVAFTLPADATQAADDATATAAGAHDDFMYDRQTADIPAGGGDLHVSFKYRHAFAMLRFVNPLAAGVTSVRISDLTGRAALCGTAGISLTDGKVTPTVPSSYREVSISGGGSVARGGVIWMPVFPQEGGGGDLEIFVTYTDNTARIITKTLPAGGLEAGKIYTVNLTGGKVYTIIANADQLRAFATKGSASANACLIADIDLGGQEWTPIASSGRFTGTFDGRGYTISGLTINSSSSAGLFGTISENGKVKNVGLSGVSITTTDYYVGGIAGNNLGTISGCFVSGTVKGTAFVGGIAGANTRGTIEDCYSTASAEATTNAQAGGIAGKNSGTLSRCYATGSIFALYAAGGITGYNGANAKISACIALNNAVTITSTVYKNIGRIAGNNDGTIASCHAYAGMTVTIAGAPQDITDGADNNLNGAEADASACLSEAMYTYMGWDFTAVWAADAADTWVYLPRLRTGRTISAWQAAVPDHIR